MADGYIMDLRKKVGHVPMVIACASVIIFDRSRGILLQKRKDNGQWCYHGGSIEPGETAYEAASRECFEEIGLTPDEMTLYTVASGEEQHFFYPNGDEVYIIDSVFVCYHFSGEIKLEESEVVDARWFALDQLPEQITQATRTPILQFAREILTKMS